MAWLSFPDWPGATSAILISFNWMGAIVKMVIKMLIFLPFLGFLAQMTLALVRVNTAFSLNQSYGAQFRSLVLSDHQDLTKCVLWSVIWTKSSIPNFVQWYKTNFSHVSQFVCITLHRPRKIYHKNISKHLTRMTHLDDAIVHCNITELPRAESCWRIDQSGLSDCHRAKYNEMQFWLHNVLV